LRQSATGVTAVHPEPELATEVSPVIMHVLPLVLVESVKSQNVLTGEETRTILIKIRAMKKLTIVVLVVVT